MKTILLILLACLSVAQAERPEIATQDYIMPRADFGAVLAIAARIAGKPVVVSSEEELKIRMPLVLPAPIAFRDVRKVIEALLMLEGYELVDGEKELKLKKVLTEKQCEVLNKALGRTRSEPDDRYSRPRVVGRADGPPPKQWVIVRAPGKQDAEQDGRGDGDKPTN